MAFRAEEPKLCVSLPSKTKQKVIHTIHGIQLVSVVTKFQRDCRASERSKRNQAKPHKNCVGIEDYHSGAGLVAVPGIEPGFPD